MRWFSINIIFLVLLSLLILVDLSLAEIYSFLDSDGVLHFTNVPSDARYRPLNYLNSKQTMSRKDRLRQFDTMILDAANKYNLDPDIIRAVVKVESDFDPLAVSKSGALGLMQLMPQTAKELKVENPFDPQENIEGGVKHFRQLWEAFDGDLVLCVAAYNAGKNAVSKNWKVPNNSETTNFVDKVLGYYHKLKNNSLLEQ